LSDLESREKGLLKSSDPNEQQKFGQICDHRTFSPSLRHTISTVDAYIRSLTFQLTIVLVLYAHLDDKTIAHATADQRRQG
jgi:hypothetical protein